DPERDARYRPDRGHEVIRPAPPARRGCVTPLGLELRLTLRAREPGAIRDLADAVSDPDSGRYGQHEDRLDLAHRVALSEAERAEVVASLQGHDLSLIEAQPGGRVLRARATPSSLASMVGEAAAGRLLARAKEPMFRATSLLPRRLSGYVEAL